jgi:large subunit ribosomal protein L19
VSYEIISKINAKSKKPQIVDVHSGDTVRVHQKIKEGNKERIQVFQGLVIRVDRKNSHNARITVRRIATGVGVEKSFLLHSPLVVKVEITRRSKVRRNYLSYMRELTGKATRLSGVDFDKEAVNKIEEVKPDETETEVEEPANKDLEDDKEESKVEETTPEDKKEHKEEEPKK